MKVEKLVLQVLIALAVAGTILNFGATEEHRKQIMELNIKVEALQKRTDKVQEEKKPDSKISVEKIAAGVESYFEK